MLSWNEVSSPLLWRTIKSTFALQSMELISRPGGPCNAPSHPKHLQYALATFKGSVATHAGAARTLVLDPLHRRPLLPALLDPL